MDKDFLSEHHRLGLFRLCQSRFRRETVSIVFITCFIIKSGTVGVSTLNVRSTASHQGRIIATLQRNASVTILNEQHGWYEIEFNGQKAGPQATIFSKETNRTAEPRKQAADPKQTAGHHRV
ncbi:SH3 domain-containing protein [Bacillus licheniformis]|nr:SH3 domain-containing protein [Bacillus licheniformis]